MAVNKNKLLAYPNIALSPHATIYQIGKSLNMVYKLHYLGVDPLTGNYSFEDYNKDGMITANVGYVPGALKDDRYVAINLDPGINGGFGTNLNYKSLSLTLTFTYDRKLLPNPFLTTLPGGQSNLYMPAKELHKYWRKPGDNAQYPRFTTGSLDILSNSDGYYTDGSFLRLNNISFTYSLPERLIKKTALTGCVFSITTSNIFTISNYIGVDPNVLSLTDQPPSRNISGNLSFTF